MCRTQDENEMDFVPVQEVFSGTKTFWRTGNTVQFKLFNLKAHNEIDVIELIMEIKDRKTNIPSIYFNTSLLHSKFCEYRILDEICKKRKEDVLNLFTRPEVLREDVILELTVAYITKRLNIPSKGRNLICLIN